MLCYVSFAQPQIFSSHICCGQMAAWINMPLGMEVGLGPGDFVLDYTLQIIAPRMHRNSPFLAQKSKKISGEGTAPSPQPTTLSADCANFGAAILWRSTSAASAPRLSPRPRDFAPSFPHTFHRLCPGRKSHRAKVPGSESSRA